MHRRLIELVLVCAACAITGFVLSHRTQPGTQTTSEVCSKSESPTPVARGETNQGSWSVHGVVPGMSKRQVTDKLGTPLQPGSSVVEFEVGTREQSQIASVRFDSKGLATQVQGVRVEHDTSRETGGGGGGGRGGERGGGGRGAGGGRGTGSGAARGTTGGHEAEGEERRGEEGAKAGGEGGK